MSTHSHTRIAVMSMTFAVFLTAFAGVTIGLTAQAGCIPALPWTCGGNQGPSTPVPPPARPPAGGGSTTGPSGEGTSQSGCGNGVCENYYSCPVSAGKGIKATEPETETSCPQDCKKQATGNLYITKDNIPTRPQQLLGGTLGDSVLRLKFHADGEAIDVTFIALMTGGQRNSLDRLELYHEGKTVPFASATTGACGAGYGGNVLCVHMQNSEFVVPKDSDVNVLVKPRIKTDVDGALSSEFIDVQLVDLIGMDDVTARGVTSVNNLAPNNGDSTANGEIFLGRNTAGSNQSIVGYNDIVVLSKIAGITNANPDADGSSIPTGISDIGQFKFTALPDTNSKNGLNKVTLSDAIFTVNATNVEIGALKLINKANSTISVSCTPFSAQGQQMNLPVRGNFYAWCRDLPGFIDSGIEQGGAQTFVLQMNITNPMISMQNTSTLQVTLDNFAKIDFQGSNFGTATSHLQWIDRDAGTIGNGNTTSSILRWAELPIETVKSTSYQSGGGGGTGPVCGNGKCEAPQETSSNCSRDCGSGGGGGGGGGMAMCPADPDGGDPTQATGVSYKTDKCRSGIPNYVNEILCIGDGKKVYETLMPCPLGKQCVNGACTANGGPTTDPKCSDSDGGINVMTKGTAGGRADVCNTNYGYENQVYEAYCTATTPSYVIMPSVPCPVGHTCSNGACVPK